jgi:hypothetical protein
VFISYGGCCGSSLSGPCLVFVELASFTVINTIRMPRSQALIDYVQFNSSGNKAIARLSPPLKKCTNLVCDVSAGTVLSRFSLSETPGLCYSADGTCINGSSSSGLLCWNAETGSAAQCPFLCDDLTVLYGYSKLFIVSSVGTILM